MQFERDIGHDEQVKALTDLLQHDLQPIPASIHIHDWGNGQAVLDRVLSQLHGNNQIVHIDPLTCPSTSILFSRLYTGFQGNKVSIDPGSSLPRNVFGDGSLDAMLHGLNTIIRVKQESSPRFIIIVRRAERMRDVWPEETVNVLFNLAKKLSLQGSLSLITISPLSLSHFRFSRAPGSHQVPLDTIVVRCGRMEKDDVVAQLGGDFEVLQKEASEQVSVDQLRSVYETYISFAYDAFAAEVRDLNELRFLSTCVWYPFIQPVLQGSIAFSQIQVLLVRSSSLFRHALEFLHTRRMNPTEWIQEILKQPKQPQRQETSLTSVRSRSLLSSIVLLSAFLASYNPARLDVRYFVRDESAIVSQSVRMSDGKMKKRKRGGALKKSLPRRRRGGKEEGIQDVLLSRQELLGPKTFTLDRLMNITQALAIEIAPELKIVLTKSNLSEEEVAQECQEEWEIRSKGVSVFESLNDLIKLGLVVRTSAVDRLDVTTTLRVNTGRETVVELAKGVNLNIDEWIHG